MSTGTKQVDMATDMENIENKPEVLVSRHSDGGRSSTKYVSLRIHLGPNIQHNLWTKKHIMFALPCNTMVHDNSLNRNWIRLFLVCSLLQHVVPLNRNPEIVREVLKACPPRYTAWVFSRHYL